MCGFNSGLITNDLLQKNNIEKNICSKIVSESSSLVFIKYLESITLAILSTVLDFIFIILSEFEFYTNYNATQNAIFLKLFGWKVFIIILLPIIINSDLIIVNTDDSLSYDDFTPDWYQSKGVSLILGAYARAFLPIWELLWRYYRPRIYQLWDRGFTMNKKKTRRKNISEYLKVYENENFDIERSYAEIMTIIFFTCFYFNVLPHIAIPALINLILIYYKDKLLSK